MCDESKLTAEEKEELLIGIDTILKKYRLKKSAGQQAGAPAAAAAADEAGDDDEEDEDDDVENLGRSFGGKYSRNVC